MRICLCVLIIGSVGILGKSLVAENPQTPQGEPSPATEEQIADEIALHSHEGDKHFFSGEFDAAVQSYEQMVELNPLLDTSHWRLGIAYFYAGKYESAAKQFEKYHSFDNVDRENGIWRFFSQKRAYGSEKAQKDLLRYEKDDREPFPGLYLMFQGKRTPQEVLTSIEQAEINKDQREARLFYAHLYIGLNEALYDREDSAIAALKLAVASQWPQTAGYGPKYMWNVGRIHLKLLEQKSKENEVP